MGNSGSNKENARGPPLPGKCVRSGPHTFTLNLNRDSYRMDSYPNMPKPDDAEFVRHAAVMKISRYACVNIDRRFLFLLGILDKRWVELVFLLLIILSNMRSHLL